MDVQFVKQWLETNQKDRFWFAEQTGYSKRTVDTWFTEGSFPMPVQKILPFLLAKTQSETPSPDLQQIKFTAQEWDALERARIQAGYTTSARLDFFAEALSSYARNLDAKTLKFPTEETDPIQSSRVAEEQPD